MPRSFARPSTLPRPKGSLQEAPSQLPCQSSISQPGQKGSTFQLWIPRFTNRNSIRQFSARKTWKRGRQPQPGEKERREIRKCSRLAPSEGSLIPGPPNFSSDHLVLSLLLWEALRTMHPEEETLSGTTKQGLILTEKAGRDSFCANLPSSAEPSPACYFPPLFFQPREVNFGIRCVRALKLFHF